MQGYKTIELDGIHAVIIHKGKVLILKRINIPLFIINPGKWSLVSGARKKGESHLDAAYREIKEETGIEPNELTLLKGNIMMYARDAKKAIRWKNRLFIFCSKKGFAKLNIENRSSRWITLDEFAQNPDISEIMEGVPGILKLVKASAKNCKRSSCIVLN